MKRQRGFCLRAEAVQLGLYFFSSYLSQIFHSLHKVWNNSFDGSSPKNLCQLLSNSKTQRDAIALSVFRVLKVCTVRLEYYWIKSAVPGQRVDYSNRSSTVSTRLIQQTDWWIKKLWIDGSLYSQEVDGLLWLHGAAFAGVNEALPPLLYL